MFDPGFIVQSIGFCIGLITIIHCINLAKNRKFDLFSDYLYVLIGINFIIFTHIFEAFLKEVIEHSLYNKEIKPLFGYLIYILSFIRLVICYKYIKFTYTLVRKNWKTIYRFYFTLIYLVFFVANISGNNELKELSVVYIHIIVVISFIIGSAIVIKKISFVDIIDTKILEVFFILIILYSIIYFLLRIILIVNYTITEDEQLIYLGILSIYFNLFNTIYLKKFSKSSIH